MIFYEMMRLMANRYYNTDDIRRELEKRLVGRTQTSVCQEIGVKPQNLSAMLKGSLIYGKVLEWLGYERVDGLYRKRKAR